MTEFLVNVTAFVVFVLLGSLVMCGWYKVTRERMIFAFWSKYWEEKKGDKYRFGKFAHVISGCVTCYSSLYGTIIYWIGGYCLLGSGEYSFGWQYIVLWLMYMLSCATANTIIIKKVL